MTFEEWYEIHLGAGTNEEFDVAKRAWDTALEEAAVVCETAPDYLQDSTFSGAARAIRALKDPK